MAKPAGSIRLAGSGTLSVFFRPSDRPFRQDRSDLEGLHRCCERFSVFRRGGVLTAGIKPSYSFVAVVANDEALTAIFPGEPVETLFTIGRLAR
jgi:hypothetical protein